MQAQNVMTTVVATISADATVQEAAKLMLRRRVSALPVMDGKRLRMSRTMPAMSEPRIAYLSFSV